ncbi:macro domain-containing protein [Rheinheimera sp.]|uniref:macro domain-containing protein n=1 Tax=Rheinheimera sp. TaxID=1869214 RepID=UPI003AF981B9
MAIQHITGNIFTSTAQTLVNTVNCEGVMGAGLALECRLRFPAMFERYQQLCADGLLVPGKLWVWRSEQRWVLNFPTKNSWKHPSRLDYLEQGLDKLVSSWQTQGIKSLALPLLGTDKGGLPLEKVITLMQNKLAELAKQIPVQIYHYDAKASDDLFQEFAAQLLASDSQSLKKATGISTDKIAKMDAAIRGGKIYQLNQLADIDGIGEKTLEKLFRYCQDPQSIAEPTQPELDW